MTETTISPNIAITRFLASAEQFAEAVSSMPEHLLDCSAKPGEWSARQIVHHVADDGDVWSMLLKKCFATPGTIVRFEGFPGNDAWAEALAFDRRPIAPALALLRAHRQLMAELAATFADRWDEASVVIAGPDGNPIQQVTAGQIIMILTGHIEEHLQTVRVIRGE